MNVLARTTLDEAERGDLSALLARCARADNHPALAEPQRADAARLDLGAHGTRALLAYDGPSLVGCALITSTSDGAAALHVAVDPGHRTSPIRHELTRTALQHRR